MTSKKIENPPQNFEEAIHSLELIVDEIENEQIALDVALDKYQQAMKLVKFCQAKLQEVEQKVKILDNESNQLKDFDIE